MVEGGREGKKARFAPRNPLFGEPGGISLPMATVDTNGTTTTTTTTMSRTWVKKRGGGMPVVAEAKMASCLLR